MTHLGLFFRDTVPVLLCLCVACSALIPASTRLPFLGQQTASNTWSTPASLTTAARVRRRRRETSCCSGGARGDEVEVAAVGVAAASGEDPFRPERASISPVVINALVQVLFKTGTEAAEAAAAALEQRGSSSDWMLTQEEERVVTSRVCGVGNYLAELRFMLATAVGRTPSIVKYGMLSDYGMCDNVEDEPLAQMNQAECLLALYMLHKEKAGVEAVDFLDADRLEVLQGLPIG